MSRPEKHERIMKREVLFQKERGKHMKFLQTEQRDRGEGVLDYPEKHHAETRKEKAEGKHVEQLAEGQTARVTAEICANDQRGREGESPLEEEANTSGKLNSHAEAAAPAEHNLHRAEAAAPAEEFELVDCRAEAAAPARERTAKKGTRRRPPLRHMISFQCISELRPPLRQGSGRTGEEHVVLRPPLRQRSISLRIAKLRPPLRQRSKMKRSAHGCKLRPPLRQRSRTI